MLLSAQINRIKTSFKESTVICKLTLVALSKLVQEIVMSAMAML